MQKRLKADGRVGNFGMEDRNGQESDNGELA